MNKSSLIDLYNKTSKHSHYQVLATPLKEIIPDDMQDVHSRWEEERLHYILNKLPCKDITVADIGGNTGYFTMELIYSGAGSALYIEGNKAHSSFVQEAVTALGWQDKVNVFPEYVKFDDDLTFLNVDVTLLLNVLHHVGDDYGHQYQSVHEAKKNILHSLHRLSHRSQYLVFQLGFNWKGNKNYPLFEKGTKKELIDFVERGVRDSWSVEHIGIAEKSESTIIYNDMNPGNIKRQDSLGEFLNRPLFIMKSRLYRVGSTKPNN